MATSKPRLDRRIVRSRNAILSAFERLLMEKPLADITVSAIAREANVDRKTFYVHFGTVDGLLDAIAVDVVEMIVDSVEKTLASMDGDTNERALGAAATFFKTVNEALCNNLVLNRQLIENIPLDDFMARLRSPLEHEIAERDLLLQEEFARFTADVLRDEEHDEHAEEHDERQPDAVIEHDAEQEYQHGDREKEVRYALRNELADGVHVVGVMAHDVAVGVRIEILDGQALHAVEQIRSQPMQKALRYDGHQLRVQRVRADAQHVDADHRADYLYKVGPGVFPACGRAVGVAVFYAPADDLYHIVEKDRGGGVGDRREDQAEEHRDHGGFMVFEEIFHQSSESTFARSAVRNAFHLVFGIFIASFFLRIIKVAVRFVVL